MESIKRVFYPKAFQPIPPGMLNAEAMNREPTTYWKNVWRTFKKNKEAMASLIIIGILVFLIIFGPMMNQYDYISNDYAASNLGPNSDHWFGTDNLGRDLWTRLWVGGRVSLLIAILSTIFPYIIGITVGGICGFFGGKVDMIIMRLIDILMGVPSLIYMILLMMVFGSGNVLTLVIAMSVTSWMGAARSTRGLVLSLRQREYIVASETLGGNAPRIISRHLIPNSMGILIVGMTMSVPGCIFSEAYLSYIGLGVTPPQPSWGQLITAAGETFRNYPYQFAIPCLITGLTILCFNLIGDGLRDAMDPKLHV
jgi:oligopeptide transport system permease protein